MKIALVGYGKMGQIIDRMAQERGHSIVARIDSNNADSITQLHELQPDVAIEFSVPHVAYGNLTHLISQGINTVCGTTGWLDHMDDVVNRVIDGDSAFLYASNFSVGVNIFFAVNKCLARLMAQQNAYSAHIEEIHHTSKKDAPSGTGLTLAQQVMARIPRYDDWAPNPSHDTNTLPLISKRIDPAPGTHVVTYDSPIDSIEIKHTAHSREGFALGALLASEYIHGRSGVYSMEDVLQINKIVS